MALDHLDTRRGRGSRKRSVTCTRDRTTMRCARGTSTAAKYEEVLINSYPSYRNELREASFNELMSFSAAYLKSVEILF